MIEGGEGEGSPQQLENRLSVENCPLQQHDDQFTESHQSHITAQSVQLLPAQTEPQVSSWNLQIEIDDHQAEAVLETGNTDDPASDNVLQAPVLTSVNNSNHSYIRDSEEFQPELGFRHNEPQPKRRKLEETAAFTVTENISSADEQPKDGVHLSPVNSRLADIADVDRSLEATTELDKNDAPDSSRLDRNVENKDFVVMETVGVSADQQLIDAAADESIFSSDYLAKARQVTTASAAFRSSEQNYLRGCKWSPDGSCILTNSADNRLRIFNLPNKFLAGKFDGIPELTPDVKIHDGELVYDFCWYPGMTVADPLTCCFVATRRDHPIHLWDSLTGQLRCSYRAFDHLDELTSAYSLTFSNDGQLLYCGYEKMIRVFNISRPGRECQTRPTFMKIGQSGIISCICVNPSMNTVYAAGSYSRSVALYSEPKGDMMCMFQGQIGGVTHMKFSPDGTKLFTGGRKDPEILCWDIRNPGSILYTLHRKVTTNQRMYFDFDSTGRYVMSGNQDGTVSIWDSLMAPESVNGGEPILKPVSSFAAHGETVNSLSCHPSLPSIVTGSGQRHFTVSGVSDSEDSDSEDKVCDNSVKVWWFSKVTSL